MADVAWRCPWPWTCFVIHELAGCTMSGGRLKGVGYRHFRSRTFLIFGDVGWLKKRLEFRSGVHMKVTMDEGLNFGRSPLSAVARASSRPESAGHNVNDMSSQNYIHQNRLFTKNLHLHFPSIPQQETPQSQSITPPTLCCQPSRSTSTERCTTFRLLCE